MADIYKEKAKEILNKALPLIQKNKKKYKGAALIMAPIFTQENVKEGYLQRVKAIDEEILFSSYNVYVDFETKNEYPTLTQIDDRHLLITLNSHNKACAKAAIKIAKACNLLYTHSVMRAMEDMIGADIHLLYKTKKIFKIWDVHGSVPEEFALADNYFEAQNAGQAEQLFIDNSDIIITVNHAMHAHLEKKYNRTLKNVVVLPIFNALEIDEKNIINSKQDTQNIEQKKPIVVYAGGVQAWQNIPLMQEIIKKAEGGYIYKIFTQDPEKYKEQWVENALSCPWEIASKTPEQVLEEYKSCRYGFVLRDDITVNNVACPTKLVEYLQYGIIPIVKTEKIGDFATMGMEYIKYTDFIKMRHNEEEYKKRATHNFKVLDKLKEAQEKGKKELLERLYEKFNF